MPPGSVSLQDFNSINVPITISGIDNQGNIVTDISAAAADTLYTSITLQPKSELRYSTTSKDPQGTYRIVFAPGTTGIHDTDDKDAQGNPIENPLFWLPPYEFYTFEVDSFKSQSTVSPGIFVARDRAYLAEINNFTRALVNMYDVSDPTNPRKVATSNGVVEGRADDITGQDASPLVGGDTLIAVSEAPYAFYGHGFQTSAVYLYRSDPARNTIRWAGGVSLTSGAVDGSVVSIAIKEARLYAATMRKGIQVVDLQAALDEFSQQSGIIGNFKIQFLLGTEGQGFANDTVISTIGVMGVPEEEYRAWLFNIKADDFLMPGATQPQTLVAATGYIPAPFANPALGNASFVVADPNAGSVVAKLLLQTSNGSSLDMGRALALGTIPYQGGTHVAVVVGIGHAAGSNCPGCSVMSVVDMTDPTRPVPLSVVAVAPPSGPASFATDVILQNGRAIVALNDGNSYVYDLTDPTKPAFLELLSGVGGKLFLYNNAVLFSSGTQFGNPTSPLNGIHAAIVDILAVVPYVSPILSQDVDLSEKNSHHRATLVPTTIYGQVFPNTVCTNNANLIVNDGTNPPKAYHVNLMNAKGQAKLPIDRFTDFPNHSFTVRLEFQLGCGPAFARPGSIKSPDRSVQLGSVKITLDSDNNTKVEDKDDDAKKNSLAGTDAADPTKDPNLAQRTAQNLPNIKKFSFWEADSGNDVISNYNKSLGIFTSSDQMNILQDHALNGLLDYAIVRVTNDGTWDPGTVRLHLMGGPATTWFITEKVGENKDYLSDQTTSQKQVASIAAASSGLNSATVICSFGFGSNQPDPAHYQGECASDGTNSVQLPSLGTGEQREFLLRCANCPVNSDGTVPSRMIQVEYNNANVNQNPDVLDRVDVDIRPLKKWLYAYTARNGSDAKPLPSLSSVSGWDPLPGDQNSNTNSATNALVLVHGFNVSQKAAFNGWGDTYFKRLYWSATPVIAPQGTTTVIVDWPGDIGDFPAPARYPQDEFRALESGVPLAHFIHDTLRSSSVGFTNVTLIAHSLGNMVVSNALASSIIQPNDVNLYLMNEAAVAAEAFGTPNEVTAYAQNQQFLDANFNIPMLGGFSASNWQQYRTTWLRQRISQLANISVSPVLDSNGVQTSEAVSITDFPDWLDEYDLFIGDNQLCIGTDPYGDVLSPTQYYRCNDPTFGWGARLAKTNLFASSPSSDLPRLYRLYYARHWGQRRSEIWSDPDSPFAGGSWQNIFQVDPGKVGRMVNSFNNGDCVLNYLWYADQLTKPVISLGSGLATLNYANAHPLNAFPPTTFGGAGDLHDTRGDNHDRQYWSDFDLDYGSEGSIFLADPFSDTKHRTLIRQWAELGLWFPSAFGPMGNARQPFESAQFQSLNLTQWGNVKGSNGQGTCQIDWDRYKQDVFSLGSLDLGSLSHSYMTEKHLTDVWGAYKWYRQVLVPNKPDPDNTNLGANALTP